MRTQNMLAQQGIQVEALGGDIQCVSISALHGTNINILTEAIALQAELIELKGDPTGLVEAVIIESSVDRYRGKLATALIQRGTLRKGAFLGKEYFNPRKESVEDRKKNKSTHKFY